MVDARCGRRASRAARVIPALTAAGRRTYPAGQLVRPLDHSVVPLHTIESRRLYRQIADQLRGLIERGELAPGARLPPERELALQLGVSRPSVREALIALEVEGLVEVRMGSGIYVRATDAPAPRDTELMQALRDAEGPLETIRARQLIEPALAAHAALHMKKSQVAGLRDAVAQMERDVAAGRMPTAGDRLFHLRIAEASENAVLLRIIGLLFDERHNPIFEQLGNHFETARSWTVAIGEHRAVIDAIAHQSAQGARQAMATHLANSHDRFTVNWAERDIAPVRSSTRPAPRKRIAARKVAA
jgi:GntR family transcriptional repressor for pyruvate dehydrogenase complex